MNVEDLITFKDTSHNDVDVIFQLKDQPFRITGKWQVLEYVNGNKIEIQNLKVFKIGKKEEKEIKYYFFRPVLNVAVQKIKQDMEATIKKKELA